MMQAKPQTKIFSAVVDQ